MRRAPRILLASIALFGATGAGKVAADEMAQVHKILGDALQSIAPTPNGFWKVVTLFSIAAGQERAKDEAAAVRTLQAARQAIEAVQENFEKSFAEYFVLSARAQMKARAGDIKGALQAAAELKNDYQRAEALRNVATAQAKAGDKAGVASTFRLALQAALAVQDKFDKASAIQFIAGAQAQAGDAQGAFQTLATLKDEGEKESGLREIGTAQAQAGDVQGAIQTAATIQNVVWKGVILQHIAAAQARAGNVREALRTAATIQWDPSKVKALREIVEGQAEAGDVKGALQTVATIQDKSEESIALGAIALAQAKAGDKAAAARTFEQARQTAGSVESEIPRAFALGAVAEAQARAGDMSGSRQTAAAVPAGHREPHLEKLVKIQAEAGDVKSALETAATMQNDLNRAQALAAVATAQAKAGKATEALAWAAKQSSPFVKANALLGVAGALLERIELAQSQPASPTEAARTQPPAPEGIESATRPERAVARPDGFMVVEARPVDAQVFLDGKLVGTAAYLVARALLVPPGRHVVQIVAPGFRSHTTQFVTDPNFPTIIRVTLVPE